MVYIPVISVPMRLAQEDCQEFKISLGYRVFNNNKSPKKLAREGSRPSTETHFEAELPVRLDSRSSHCPSLAALRLYLLDSDVCVQYRR